MTAALVVGSGAVGTHAAAQLAETRGIDRVLVADIDPQRSQAVVDEVGGTLRAVRWAAGDPFPDGVGVVVCALPAGHDVPVVQQAVERRLPAVSAGDDPDSVQRLLDLDATAREAGVAVGVGAGLAPGLSEVLARYAADLLDEVHEVHVARTGIGGPACEARRRRALLGTALEVDDGALVPRRAGGARRLVHFPPPVGALDCRRVAAAVPLLLLATLPDLRAASARGPVSWETALPGRLATVVGGRRAQGLAGLHVEVRGRRGGVREFLAFGLVDRMAAAAGTVLAVAAGAAAGLGAPDIPSPVPGVHSLGSLAPPVPLLVALRRRGVRAARFEGDAVGGSVGEAQANVPLRP